MTKDIFDFAFVRIKFKEIRPDNLNPRHHRDPEADLTLRRLIDTHGTIDIMWICKGENDHFRLLDGHRRYDIRVEDKYLETNPTVTCAMLLAKDNPDRLLTEEEITLWRILRERGKEKWKDFDFYLKAVEHADSQKEKGRKYFQIAREDFDWRPERLSSIKSVVEDPILSDFLRHDAISMHDAMRLINLPAETQKALIDAREDLSAKELRETVKLAREGVETASAIESVITLEEEVSEPPQDDARSVLINSIDEDLRERFTKATKDMNLHDIERIVKLIDSGVVMHDAIRTVKLKTEIPQGTEQDALTVHEEEGEHAEEKDTWRSEDPSSSETQGIVGETLGLTDDKEKGAEEIPADVVSLGFEPQSPPLEEGIDIEEELPSSQVQDVEPSPETKPKTILPFINKIHRWTESTSQFVQNDDFALPRGKKLDTLLGKCHEIRECQGRIEQAILSKTSGNSFHLREVIRQSEKAERLKDCAHHILADEEKAFDHAMNKIGRYRTEAMTIKTNRNLLAKRGG